MTPLDLALWLVTVLSWLGILVVFGALGFTVGVIVHAVSEVVRGMK